MSKVKPRPRLVHRRLYERVYTSTVHLHIGDPGLFQAWLHKAGHNDLNVCPNVVAKWVALRDEDLLTSHVFLSERLLAGSVVWRVSSIAHEAFHATSALMRNVGLPHCEGSEEAWTYYLSWVVAGIHEELEKLST